MSRYEEPRGSLSGWRLLGWWLGLEAAMWVLVSSLGYTGSVWFMTLSAFIGIVFFMVWGAIRVLRGHDL